MSRTKQQLRSRLLWLALVAALLFAGNWAGHRVARSGILGHHRSISADLPRDPAAGISAPPRPHAEPVRSDQLAAATQRLMALRRGSPNLQWDWEALGEMDRILSTLSTSELAALYDQMDVSGGFSDWAFVDKVGAYWAAKDPDAAIRAALAKSASNGESFAIGAFQEWSADQPAAALAWLKNADLPDKLAENFRHHLLTFLIDRDFSVASSEFLQTEGEEAGQLIQTWGQTYSDDPGMREKLVDLAKGTGRPEDYEKLNAGLLESWPQDDALGMLNYIRGLKDYLESGAVPAESRAGSDAAAVAAAMGREYTGPALEWWMERHAGDATAPEALSVAIQTWTYKKPDAALQWLAQQPESPQRDALNASAMAPLVNTGHYAEAAKSVADIRDPEIQQRASERLDYLWTAKDPAGAAAWRATLPAGKGH